MKRLLPAILAVLLLAPACRPSAAPAAPDISAMQTQAVGTAYAMLTLTAPAVASPPLPPPTATPLLLPTATSTPDFSVIKYTNLYFNGTTGMVLVFALNGARGEFRLTGNNYVYACAPAPDNPDQLLCRGAYQAPGREVVFKLYEAGRAEPLLTLALVIPSLYPPTPEGMRCEIEPLWVAPLTGPEGCYAVTCYLNGQYYDGTPNTCDQPWRWPVP